MEIFGKCHIDTFILYYHVILAKKTHFLYPEAGIEVLSCSEADLFCGIIGEILINLFYIGYICDVEFMQSAFINFQLKNLSVISNNQVANV